MKDLYCLSIQNISIDQAWHLLESVGIEILYSNEDEDQFEIYALIPSKDLLSLFDWIKEISPYTLPSIDWDEQWAMHAQNFHEGYASIDFSEFGRKKAELKLQPGPGFGDLSHPTTRLMLKLLAKYLNKQTVIDIGCGSGILALAALRMDATYATGIDIDESAVHHSYLNACLNQLEEKCHFCTPEQFKWLLTSQPTLLLMNMIQSEQKIAWSSLSSLHAQPGECLTSGIRKEERETYLSMTSNWGWKLKEEEEEEGWVAFYFVLQNMIHQ